MNKYCGYLDASPLLNAVENAEKKHGAVKVLRDGFNVLMYMRMSLKDIFQTYKLFYVCENTEERNLLARTLANHIWESFKK